ncbi:LysR family transcriptional regulator [Comamonas sp. B21-038]|uniref:LysR family transcriptional regulator n=1 Tax=Comamonas sp. B21-038 TaxID=2918299 RepID=UPI001EFA7FE3|nr:LysR family transcriptional regulator [Comamonas sp. B21-038]ULR90864.1 LysR family transcriptional regulator [Comamonas sp. B21-038]
MHVSLRQLQVFLCVAQCRSFSQTGQTLGLTQSAVSRAMVELEGQLHVRLLDRTTREVLLTDAGQLLAQKAAPLLQELADTLAEVADVGHAARGQVRIASSPTLSAALMPACIAACNRELPQIQLQLVDRLQQEVLAQVRSGDVHFGVVVEPPELGDLDYISLQLDPFVAVLPPAHPLMPKAQKAQKAHKATSLRWDQLRGEPLVLLDHASGSRRLMDAALLASGCGPEHCPVVQEVGHVTTAFRMVEAGIGISIMPGLAIPAHGLSSLQVCDLLPQVQRAIMLVRRRQRSLPAAAQAVWDLVARRLTTAPTP